jgi:hypothetical protein
LKELNIKYSKHARKQMIERGISEQEVEKGIRKGAKSLQKPDRILSDHRYYCIVYKKIEDIYFVITVKPRW